MEIITTTELRSKEIINICNGARLGYACDFQFNKCTAQITGLIVEQNRGFLGIGSGDILLIPWCKIQCIGEDIILVNFTVQELNSHFQKRKKGIFDASNC